MAFASYNTLVNINQAGASTAFTSEATTLVGGFTYQITNTAKRCWDPAVPVQVYVGGAPATPAAVDYLLGRVRLLSTPSGAVTVSGSYLPLLLITTAKAFSLDLQFDVVDVTKFTATERYHAKQPTLLDASFTIDAFDTGQTIFDDGSEDGYNADTFANVITSGSLKVVEVVFVGVGKVRRLACYLSSANVKGSPSSVIEASVAGTLTRLAAGVDISFSEMMPDGQF